MTLKILIAALLPVAILLFYIYRKDKAQPEPVGQLLKAFFFGILTVPVAVCLALSFEKYGLYTENYTTVLGSINNAFWSAAIPEEMAKLFFLWLLLRKNKYFDERMDGIVYAVFISMGFAAIENMLYLFDSVEDYISIGLVRGLFSIPGHFCFAILMGYYYSLLKFYPKNKVKHAMLALIAPVLAHGIYDGLLFTLSLSPVLEGLIVIAFIGFCCKTWKYASKRIEDHLKRDLNDKQ